MRRFMMAALAAVATTVTAQAGEPKSLDMALKEQGPKLLKYAEGRGAKNVGFLKFLVRSGDGPLSDNAGPINTNLSRRLGVAMILALPNDDIGVISNANEVLEKSQANHLDDAGRMKCFRGRGFTLAWGDRDAEIKPDLFITGVATLSNDLKTTTVKLQAFGKDGKIDESLGDFTARTSAQTLVDTGHRYLLTKKNHPKFFEGARGVPEEEFEGPIVDLSKKYSAELKNEPLPSFEQEAPIRVTLYYNDSPIEVKDGVAREPKEDEKVWFRIDNNSKEVHGVVLKINGVNTIYREKFADRDCHKWILKPGATVIVRGFQMKLTEREDFVVQSPKASRENEVRYGEHAGTFTVTAFRANDGKTPDPKPEVTPKIKEEQQIAAAISRGSLQVEGIPPGDLKTVQSKLRNLQADTEGSRGLVDGDPTNPKPHVVEKTAFAADPKIPVMSYSIRYYNPTGK